MTTNTESTESTVEYPEIVNEAVDADYWTLVEEGLTTLDTAEEPMTLYIDPSYVVAEKSSREQIPVHAKEDENGEKIDVSHIGYVHELNSEESTKLLQPHLPRLKPFVLRLDDRTIKIDETTEVDLNHPDLIMLFARIYGTGELKAGQVLRAGNVPTAK